MRGNVQYLQVDWSIFHQGFHLIAITLADTVAKRIGFHPALSQLTQILESKSSHHSWEFGTYNLESISDGKTTSLKNISAIITVVTAAVFVGET